MWDRLFIYLFILHNIGFAECFYPPMGDEVQAGSVLLPASRRGRYLANVARRQAVDGTGIKFNKDADRINAEAKKKLDVLSEDLLPYIVAEQERRITLYKRVMTAIQNGEKGVTIAEIRNKPPAIIRKGLMYRCPTNLPPREPDGSGVIICEADLKPTPIMFESCLSAEDKELYVAENKYFFCNRHKVEGPDLPRNGTTVIACAPRDRTPLNYTSRKCAVEETDDVVVHYRYYPDRTYKFVSELDPLREVCDHWNPCQVGYIFSLPGPDQATPASELWLTATATKINFYDDSKNEMFPLAFVGKNSYTTSMRVENMGSGVFAGVGHQYNTTVRRRRLKPPFKNTHVPKNVIVDYQVLDKHVKVTITFHPLLEENYGMYYVRFNDTATDVPTFKYFIFIERGRTKLIPQVLDAMPGQQLHPTSVTYECKKCAVEAIVLRAAEGSFRKLESYKYWIRDKQKQNQRIEFMFGTLKTADFGDYFLVIRNDDGSEERVKAISIKVIKLSCIRTVATVGKPVTIDTTYKCAGCELVDVLCNGESVLASGSVKHDAHFKRISLKIARFEDQNACVYLAKFKIGNDFFRKRVAIIEKVKLVPIGRRPPTEMTYFSPNIKFNCTPPGCDLKIVTTNGGLLDRGPFAGANAYYNIYGSTTSILIKEYSSLYEGVYQGVFTLGANQVTKTLMVIGHKTCKNESMQDSGRKYENQNYLPETESQAAAEGDGGKDAPLPDGELGRKHLSPPRTRRSAAGADKSTP